MIRKLLGITLAAAFGVAILGATSAYAGNIALTGHDDDFHCSGLGSDACNQLQAMVTFARAGSTNPLLPVLTFDQGSQLTTDLTAMGIAFTNISTAGAINAALFNPAIYSAFVVASHTSCGGCDNSSAFVDAISAQSAAITTFFNAGGGIVGLSAGSYANYYNFVPQSAGSPVGSPPSTGYVQTACGATFGVGAVNGNATHNFFSEPGTGGVSSLYCVAERLSTTSQAMTLLLQGGTITTGVITTGTPVIPEPATILLLGSGLAMAARRLRRKQ